MSSSPNSASADLAERILAQAADALIYARRDGRIERWNAAAQRVFGFSAAEAIGQSLDLIIPAHLRAGHWRGWDAAMASALSAESRALHQLTHHATASIRKACIAMMMNERS